MRNHSTTTQLIPITQVAENIPHNSQQRKRADWRQTHCLTEKEGHRPEEALCEKSWFDVKELKRNEFLVVNAWETPQEREGVETGAAPSSVRSLFILRTMMC
ncbi:uncharacterized protein MONOS_14865 [Monocercomonoides exilis]|uniref:uncharacterized protein n=1 Tax=Monocercomonoides exilis TaxID=2049356 RepID=UPI00355AB3DC|nr:hypothetical protein MONOS_14865 [Monocercomonoides exilis]|eukprot:MONOS_14865.1-p1 / transcript=MONOS_14865.1 / gene=MONOS_14865 / organism=Monocercomonoides_exilis_PA203 / gene_product=unspecified product / transcript_product=unspecified product / location=Mono_scaffold01089:8031-8336(-) / protein_length=102 / sequence_SO=supercontig / SO=protein_coding / is_pseudo=false